MSEPWRQDPESIVGREVRLWVGLTMNGYPERGTVKQYIKDYPGGPTFEVVFPPNDFVPFACLKPEWVFLVPDADLTAERPDGSRTDRGELSTD